MYLQDFHGSSASDVFVRSLEAVENLMMILQENSGLFSRKQRKKIRLGMTMLQLQKSRESSSQDSLSFRSNNGRLKRKLNEHTKPTMTKKLATTEELEEKPASTFPLALACHPAKRVYVMGCTNSYAIT